MIDLPNDEPDVVEKMIKFMYHGNFSDGRNVKSESATTITTEQAAVLKKVKGRTAKQAATSPTVIWSSPESSAALLLNSRVYIIAELYDVPQLKELAKNKYQELVLAEWTSLSFVASLKLMYESTPESDRMLKDVAIKAAAGHIRELVDRGEFAALCKENGEIAFDILKAPYSEVSAEDTSFYSSLNCGYCGVTGSVTNGENHGAIFHCGSCGYSFN